MCGITGWVGFARDLTREAPVVQSMIDTLAHRGPDGGDSWYGRHAALAVRRLAVIDLAGGHQPMVAEEGGAPVAVLAYTGEVFNYRELAAELRARGHRFSTTSDTEVVLRSYLEWGDGCPERFEGMFAFAVWDVRREEMFLARDRVGIYPLYYYPTADGMLVGSEPKAVLANPLVEPEVDADGMRELLSLAKTPGHAVYRGMRELRPGHTLRAGRAGSVTRTYWALEAREHTDDLPTTIATVRELLDSAVGHQLVSEVPLCTLLSGGLDSCIVGALASRGLAAAGHGPLHTFCVDFAGYAEHFKADELRRTPDAPFADDAAAHIGSVHRRIVLDTADLVEPAARGAVLRARDLPTPMQDMYTSLYLLSRAVREHSKVALSGDASDELFGGYVWYHDPRYYEADHFPWVAISRRMQMLPLTTGLLDPGLVAALDVEAYESDRYVEALREVPRLAGEQGRERRMREVSYLNLTRYLQIVLDRKDRMGMGAALEGRVPFCDHRLLEYVFNVPWSMKSFDGREKSLLRAAVADLLPGDLLARRKSPYPATRSAAYGQALRRELAELLASGAAPAGDLLDRDLAAAVLDPADRAGRQVSRSSIEMALQLDRWLASYGVRLVLEGVRV